MSKKKKSKRRNKNPSIVALLRVSAFLFPLPVYLFFVLFLFPAPNSGFLVLGIVGSFAVGAGLMNIAGLYDDNYLGHAITGVALGFGSLLILVSSVIMYVPSIYTKFDERYVTLYYLVWTALIMCAIWYMFFRHAVKLHLRDRGISKTSIDKALKGKRNFWWYEVAQREYSMGWIYILNKGFTILFAIAVIVHMVIGWIKSVSIAMAVVTGLLCLMCEPMWILSNLSGQLLKTPEARKFKRTIRSPLALLFPAIMCVALVIYLFRYL